MIVKEVRKRNDSVLNIAQFLKKGLEMFIVIIFIAVMLCSALFNVGLVIITEYVNTE